jgi:heavy metal sensor kinase
MKNSIRTRLTSLITLVYLSVFFLLIIAGGLALYLGLTEEIDKKLRLERDQMVHVFEDDFFGLLSTTSPEFDLLSDDFSEELEEIYAYTDQFVIFSLRTDSGPHIYYNGGIKDVKPSVADNLLSSEPGFYNRRLGDNFYRASVTKQDWGILVLGIEGQTFFEIADQLKDILLVGVPLTLILVVLGGRFLAGIVMRPVVASAEATEKISLTNLSERLPEYTGKDEFGKLVSTLNRMIARLEEGIKRVQQFTQDAAHELRTPLTTIRGELELVYQQDSLHDDLKAAIQKSLDKAILMGRIVENLMLLAQSDTGNYPVQKTTFQLHELVIDAIDDMKSLVESRPITVTLAHCDEIEVSADRQLIHRLVLNLCDNAVRFTKKGRIEVTLRRDGGNAEFVIQDTGIGIPIASLPHIFDRFYRVDKARSRANGGSGLGLSICKWITDAHSGKIFVDSEMSKGTTIRVCLPVNHSIK